MNKAPLYIVDIIGEVVQAADAVLFPTLNRRILYTYGRSIQILTKLQILNSGQSTKNSKFPLFALFQDFPENMGVTYTEMITFPKIIIAMLTTFTDDPPTRYGKTFKPVLYPIWQEFLRQLALHPNIVGNDPAAFPHIKWDRPGTQPEGDKTKGSNFNEYVDAIEIQNLQLTFKTVNPQCSKRIKINSQ